ncbi:DotU family type VI secretion system protein [Parachitinimonas caeni]|uniref:DotU family type VI secretion system protein n=1 Tax=Parachitinimonas caeni TaxID=3031301 RepID=A0ABT7E2T1_9NEIS|nr:DotU family type VI secretion system protein [Parachitinimonas caeni]MDK2126554.1 DotU family type VI secretion system protein [Parachitinimonas caeni]
MDIDFNLIKPSPGGSGSSNSGGQQPGNTLQDLGGEHNYRGSGRRVGMNPLLKCANPVLYMVGHLRQSQHHPDPSALRDYLADRIREFEDVARADGIRHENVIAARYVLCTFLDEVVASTPWGGSGIWSRHSLLVMFHNETWGGEKFFQLLSKLAENPAGNLDVLELMYSCLCLGFEGRYRVVDGGGAQLELLRRRLLELLRKQRGAAERDLSPNWKGVVTETVRKFAAVPLWVVVAVGCAVLMAIYMAFVLRLNAQSDPVFVAIQNLRAKAPVVVVEKPAAKPRLVGLFEKEVREGLVSVMDSENRSVVTIRGDGLFESGSAQLNDRYLPLLNRIGDELNKVPGKVLITGHTDNVPVRSLWYPSNWHLSKARAEAVKDILAVRVAANRIEIDGRSDMEPVAPNDTPANKARNRRVEITVFVTK